MIGEVQHTSPEKRLSFHQKISYEIVIKQYELTNYFIKLHIYNKIYNMHD